MPAAADINCYHVNTRFSEGIGDMGAVRIAKFFLVFRYCFEAIWCRFRFGVRTFFFCPAPPKRPALYRDWLVMLICRPFFDEFVHYWQAAGLGDWLESEATAPERWITRRLLGKASLGVALAVANLRDPLWLRARQVAVVPNGVEDPFPDFATSVLPRRQARLEVRRRLIDHEPVGEQLHASAGSDGGIFRLLYLAHCFRGKGIFETLEGVAIARSRLAESRHPLRIHLTIAGDFASAQDKREFIRRIACPDLSDIVTHVGFVAGAQKNSLLRESDCICFPTYYHLESFGIVVVEAMAAGMSIITTRWRALPEMLPPRYAGFVPVRDARAVAERIQDMFCEDAVPLRALFLERFTENCHLRGLHNALFSSLRSGPGSGVLFRASKM